jgi:hypothetical protein
MAAPLVDRTVNDIIPPSDHNDVKDYIEDGAYRVKTAWTTMIGQSSSTSVDNNSIFIDSSDGHKLKHKDNSGVVTEVGRDFLPSQSTHGGKFLRTDGTNASWSSLNLLNNTFLQGRNNANSAFVDIIKINTNDKIEFGGDVEFGTLLLSAQVAPSTPSADNAYVYVTASGTTPNRVIELKTKNESGVEVTLSSVVV